MEHAYWFTRSFDSDAQQVSNLASNYSGSWRCFFSKADTRQSILHVTSRLISDESAPGNGAKAYNM